MTYRSFINRILFLLFLAFSAATTLQAQDLDAGKAIFKAKCASCHNKNMKDDLTGPALGGVEARWADYPTEDLYAWIRNSQAMIATGHPRATEVWNAWKPVIMNPFPELTDEEIVNLLAYIDGVYNGTYGPVTVAGGDAQVVVEESGDNSLMFIVIASILAILALVLARIVANLNYMAQAKEGNAPARRRTLGDILTSRGLVSFVIFALVVLGGYTTVNNAISLGRQQGYQPEQPIKFSHATHAGLQKVDCQYCHDGARRSKHSVIPAANTCMNCHRAIKKGSKYGTAELTKIYASIGYDPTTDKYVKGYEDFTNQQVLDLYERWITDNYVKDNGKLDNAGKELVEAQLEGIQTSLTNPTKSKIQGPIEWIRIHNLPDHAYFNHAQHVSVGQVECQTCHGPIQEMEVVQQYAPLSMGWCVNCHRQTEVKFAENDYYKSYEKYHEEMAAGTRDKVTVEEIGGLECQKCHY